MSRSMVALLAAVATAMLVLAALAHGALFLGMVADAVFANGLVAYVTAPALTKNPLGIPQRPGETGPLPGSA